MMMTRVLVAATAAVALALSAGAAPAPAMKVKMATFFVTSAEKGGGMAKSNMRDARQRVDELLKTSADDPAVIALDVRLKKLEAGGTGAKAGVPSPRNDTAAGAAPKNKVNMAEYYVKDAEKCTVSRGSAVDAARECVDELLKAYASDPAVVALDARLKKVEEAIAAAETERAAAEKAREEKLVAEKKAEEEAAAAKKAALAHKAPLPWLMAKEDRDAIAKYVDGLGKVTDVKEIDTLKAALVARAAEDRKIVEAKGEESEKAKDELGLYNLFLDQLGHLTLVGFFEGKVDLKADKVEFKELRIRTSNSSVYVRTSAKDGKEYFYEMNGARCYVEGDDLEAVNEARRRFVYVDRFLKDQADEDCRRDAASALLSANLIDKALAVNSPDLIEFAPMPKKGTLHAEFAKAALSTITTQADNYKDVYDVVIDADYWQTETKLGNVVRRKFGGWGLKKLKHGIRAFRVQWCQDHLGGGKYAPLRLYATAGGSMYVK